MAQIDLPRALAVQIVNKLGEYGLEQTQHMVDTVTAVYNSSYAAAVFNRMIREYGELSASNFALDIMADTQTTELQRLAGVVAEKDESNQALVTRAQKAEHDCELLREQIDPKRAGRFSGPHKARSG